MTKVFAIIFGVTCKKTLLLLAAILIPGSIFLLYLFYQKHTTFYSQHSTSLHEPVVFHFELQETDVHVFDSNTKSVSQTILLSDLSIQKPPESFSELSPINSDHPILLTKLDINFDGYNDLGILVDTGPIESGYVFYMYNSANKIFIPTRLTTAPDSQFVVYAPSLLTTAQLLQGKFTVTNPRQVEYYQYIYNKNTDLFTEFKEAILYHED